MEFSFTPTPKNRHWHWDFHDDVQGILEPSRRLSHLYSKHQKLLPKSVVPNNVSSVGDIPFEDDEMCDLLTFSPKDPNFERESILCAYEYGQDLQHLSRCEHSHYCRFELANHDNDFEYHPTKQDNDIWLPKLYDKSNNLRYEIDDDSLP